MNQRRPPREIIKELRGMEDKFGSVVSNMEQELKGSPEFWRLYQKQKELNTQTLNLFMKDPEKAIKEVDSFLHQQKIKPEGVNMSMENHDLNTGTPIVPTPAEALAMEIHTQVLLMRKFLIRTMHYDQDKEIALLDKEYRSQLIRKGFLPKEDPQPAAPAADEN